MALNSLYCADEPLSNYSLTPLSVKSSRKPSFKSDFKESSRDYTVLQSRSGPTGSLVIEHVYSPHRAEKMQYKTEKDTTDTYKDKRNIQIQKYFKQPYRPITIGYYHCYLVELNAEQVNCHEPTCTLPRCIGE